jgi:hypothetical protein
MCIVFAKVPEKLRRKVGEKAFRGVMVGYPHDAPGYRVYNPATRRITTSLHVVFQENTPGLGTRRPINSRLSHTLQTPTTPKTSHPDSIPLSLTQSRSPHPISHIRPTARPASDLTPFATENSWSTSLITLRSL